MITRKLLRAWGACYSNSKIKRLVPADGLTALQVADISSVPPDDRVWVLSRIEGLILPEHGMNNGCQSGCSYCHAESCRINFAPYRRAALIYSMLGFRGFGTMGSP